MVFFKLYFSSGFKKLPLFIFKCSGEDQEALFEQILRGKLEFPAPHWDNVSDTAKVCDWNCPPHLPLQC